MNSINEQDVLTKSLVELLDDNNDSETSAECYYKVQKVFENLFNACSFNQTRDFTDILKLVKLVTDKLLDYVKNFEKRFYLPIVVENVDQMFRILSGMYFLRDEIKNIDQDSDLLYELEYFVEQVDFPVLDSFVKEWLEQTSLPLPSRPRDGHVPANHFWWK